MIATKQPTSKDYSFSISDKDPMITKPVSDLDSLAKNETSLSGDTDTSNDGSLTNEQAQKLVPGAVQKYLHRSNNGTLVGENEMEVSFDVGDNYSLQITRKPDDDGYIEMAFHIMDRKKAGLDPEVDAVESRLYYDKKTNKYLSETEKI